MTTLVASVLLLIAAAASDPTVVDTLPIDTVWSGHPVGFCLLTHVDRQYVAYYNAERQMVVGQRSLDQREWTRTVLPEQIGWDSHNSIVMTIDADGFLHLSGNMHCHPLKYFRSTEPWDASTLERVTSMVGRDEERVTYPVFLEGPDRSLIFTYRDGGSGSGNQIYNTYDIAKKTWRRLLDSPLTDGRGEMNAYFHGPVLGPDDYYHLAWVWRDTPDCATNHDVSYARSRDLVHWERANGEPLSLPMTLENSDVVDPVPAGGGAINGNVAIGSDDRNRVVISYHKYDTNGKSQIYNARLEDGAWKIYQTSAWDFRWEFGGNGAIPFDVRVSPVRWDAGQGLIQPYSSRETGSGRWLLDTETLKVRETLPPPPKTLPANLYNIESDFPGMQVRIRDGRLINPSTEYRYVIRWETLGPNRDKPRDPPWPDPSPLRLIVVKPPL